MTPDGSSDGQPTVRSVRIRDVAETVTRMVRARDPYTYTHQARVTELAEAIARAGGLDEDDIVGVAVAARLHDIGKMSVPSEILTFPGRLKPEAMELMKGHSRSGYDLLVGVDFPWPVADVVLQHHERIDGSGYPSGLSGDDIHLHSRIVAVADVAESMISHRPYRPALPVADAVDELESGAGTRYDQGIADACSAMLRSDTFGLSGFLS